MTHGELERFLMGHALRLQRLGGNRHVGFELQLANGVVVLPTLIRISRGSGDISPRTAVSIARGLGLKELELRHAVHGSIRRECLLMALLARLLDLSSLDPVVYGKPVLEAAGSILNEIASGRFGDWTAAEKDLISRLRPCLEELRPVLPAESWRVFARFFDGAIGYRTHFGKP